MLQLDLNLCQSPICRKVTQPPGTPACCRREAAVTSVSTKQCYGCGVVRAAEWYPLREKAPSGLHPRCKPCRAHDVQQRAERLQRERATREPPTEKQCRLCEGTFPIISFSADPNQTDGFRVVCKSCVHITYSARKQERAVRLREQPPMAPQPKERICSACKETKPRSEFSRNRSTIYGLDGVCKKCKNQSRALSRK